MTTATLEITDEKVMQTLKEIVSERPDYVYTAPDHLADDLESCYYVHWSKDGMSGEPGCGIGHLLHRLGVPLEDMRRSEGVGAWSVMVNHFPSVGNSTRNTLSIFQRLQDEGDTWGDSLERAIAMSPAD